MKQYFKKPIRFFLIIINLIILFETPSFAEFLVIQNGIYTVRPGSGLYCTSEQNLFVQSKKSELYLGGNNELDIVLKKSIEKMQKRCGNLKKVVINGEFDDKWYYWATASKVNNWKIEKSEIVKDNKGYLEPYMFPKDREDLYKRGLMFLSGGRLARDKSAGFSDISESARWNYPEAQYLLGRFNEEGFVDPKNEYNAVALYKKAAAQGHQKAKDRLDQLSSNNKQKELEKIKNLQQWNRKGIVFKSDRFWQDLVDFDAARRVFNGDFSGAKSDVKFKRYFVDFIETYSNRCQSFLPPESVKHTYIVDEIKTNEYGVESRRRASRTVTYVDKRYYPYYVEYIEDINNYDRQHPLESFSIIAESVNNGVLSALEKLNYFRMSQFFDKAKNCESATLIQMQENFLRAAKGMPPLQMTNIVLENAERESDSIEASVRQKTFVQACMDYHGEIDPQHSHEKWCTCLNRELASRLTSSEMSKYADNINSFYKTIRRIETTNVTANDPGWRLVNASNRCKN